jgi:hypothetical protein
LQAAGAALALCFQAGEAGAHLKQGTWYVHQKPVTIQKVAQTCCNPVVTFYDVKWGDTPQGSVHFEGRHPHAHIAWAKPGKLHPENVNRGRALIATPDGLNSWFIKLRD